MLGRMAASIDHRGPDARTVEVVGQVGLAHTRLAIVDPTPAGAQPMWSADGTHVISYNGEVFNHLELRERLPGHAWRGHSDTETLIELIASEGLGVLPLLNGLFAFAVVNTQTGHLHLARDRWGVKPLYVATLADGLAFGSEFGPLFEAGLSREPDQTMLREAMFGWVHGPWTPLQGVRRLMPGHSLTIDLTTMVQTDHRWFAPADLVDRNAAKKWADVSRAEAADLMEKSLSAAVHRRLMADVPLGTMCSGGVDSSLITALASQHQPVVAYCAAVTDQPEKDESPYARMVARHLGIELREVPMSGETWRRDLVATVQHVGYPLTHANSVPMFQVASAAHADKVKVLLSGEGADELLGGYGYLHRRAYQQFEVRSSLATRSRQEVMSLLRSHGLVKDPHPDHLQAPSETVRAFQREVINEASAAYRHHHGPRRRLESALLVDLSLYLPHLLNRQDKSTMQASVETRVPFLDPDVVMTALNLPLERRITPDRKTPLKDIARKLLPSEIADRRKMGFGFDIARYLTGHTKDTFLKKALLQDQLAIADDEWAQHCASASGLGLLLLWTGEIWCRLNLAGESEESVSDTLWL